jgi:hypothetical protein
LDKIYEGEDGGLERAANIAAQRFVALINEKWKAADVAEAEEPTGPLQTVAVTVPFSSIGQWNGIRAQLMSVAGVASVDVTTMASGGAHVRLGFTTQFPVLQQSLAVVGMKLVEIRGNWVLQPL